MLAELKISWDAKSARHAQRNEQRRKELLALQDASRCCDGGLGMVVFLVKVKGCD